MHMHNDEFFALSCIIHWGPVGYGNCYNRTDADCFIKRKNRSSSFLLPPSSILLPPASCLLHPSPFTLHPSPISVLVFLAVDAWISLPSKKSHDHSGVRRSKRWRTLPVHHCMNLPAGSQIKSSQSRASTIRSQSSTRPNHCQRLRRLEVR